MAVLLLLAAALPAKAGMGEDVPAQIEAAAAEPEIARGLASWYGKRFHGRRTASGEVFDMEALTAAHPTLPFGTVVKVRSLVNGREVEVRINDRGPHVGRRLIDLSRAAAKALGLLDAGTGTKPVAISLMRGPAGGGRPIPSFTDRRGSPSDEAPADMPGN